MFTKKPLFLGIVVLVAIAVGVGSFFLLNPKKNVTTTQTKEFTEAADDLGTIPTVGPGVKVALESIVPKQEIKLMVEGIPVGTKSLEYELTYSTKDQDSQGVFSTAKPEKGSSKFGSTFMREITLGTCSRNVCKYHEITSPIKVSLKFEGDYGAQIFQKEYDLASL